MCKQCRERMTQQVPLNIRETSDSPFMSGEEVDLLVSGLESGHPPEHWRVFEEWLTAVAWGREAAVIGTRPEDIDDLVATGMEKIVRAMTARLFLLGGSTTTQLRSRDRVTRHCFTHAFILRRWMRKTLHNAAIDVVRTRQSGGLDLTDVEELRDPELSPEEALGQPPHPLHLFSALAVLVERDHSKKPGQPGWVRAQHMRHTLARLPHRYVAVIDLKFPSLALGELPVAHDDVDMAKNLTEALNRPVTPGLVQQTRLNYRKFIAKHHPDLVATLEYVLREARR